jgi:hypothetical protein
LRNFQEPTVVTRKSTKAPYTLHILRLSPTEDIIHLAWINNNSTFGDNVPKKGHFFESKFTLAKLGIEKMITKLLKTNTDMFCMLFFSLGKDNNAINKDYHKDIEFFKEDRIHQVHEICRGIG